MNSLLQKIPMSTRATTQITVKTNLVLNNDGE
jgi:hypothetical protein